MVDSGVYKIENLVNGKLYIGSSLTLRRRWLDHLRQLRAGRHNNPRLQAAYAKYGEKSFRFKVLRRVKVAKGLVAAEQRWLDKLRCADAKVGYNIREIAESNLGLKYGPHSVAARRQISRAASASLKGHRVLKKTRKKISTALMGRIGAGFTGYSHSADARARMSCSHTGKVLSEGHKKKMSESHKGKKYKPMSAEGRKNIGDALRGRKHSAAQVRKNREAHTGLKHRPMSVIGRSNLSKAHMGQVPWQKKRVAARLAAVLALIVRMSWMGV